MSKGFLLFAQNNSTTDYVRQAYALACSIKATQKTHSNVCLITDKTVSDKYSKVFDQVIVIQSDDALNSEWKIENRYKIYDLSPYEETIVLDTDMLVLSDLLDYWQDFSTHDICFTTDVRTFRNKPITTGLWYYRKAFVRFELPNTYVALHYFKKTTLTKMFAKYLEIINKNWEVIYGTFTGGNAFQKWASIDVSAALAIRVLDIEKEVTPKNSVINFTHMKVYHQEFDNLQNNWQDYVTAYMTDELELFIGNYKQDGVFHYIEDSFLSDKIIKKYEKYLNYAEL